MYLCVRESEWQKHQHTPPACRLNGRCNIFASSTDFRSLFHLPNVWHVLEALLLQLCHSCVAARQLDVARQPAYLAGWLAISCGSIDLRFEYPSWPTFAASLAPSRNPPDGRGTVYGGRDAGYKVTLIASTSDTRLSCKRPVTCVESATYPPWDGVIHELCKNLLWQSNCEEIQKDCHVMDTI